MYIDGIAYVRSIDIWSCLFTIAASLCLCPFTVITCESYFTNFENILRMFVMRCKIRQLMIVFEESGEIIINAHRRTERTL